MKESIDPNSTRVSPLAFCADRLKAAAKGLSPSYFAMVMATGIVSIAANMMDMPSIAMALFWLNVGFYLVLWLLSLLRIICYPRAIFDDILDHQRGPGFFTLIAGSCVLGSQFILIMDNYQAALVLWVIGTILWAGLNYTIFTAITVKRIKPPLDQGITGAWLLAVVAPQSISVLSALMAGHTPYQLELNFIALSMWMWGGMLYIWMMVLIFYRYSFFSLLPSDLTPPYWINMGAMAISTLAGSLLILNAPDIAYLQSMLPFLKGFTVFYWAIGTWWIPMLLILGVWRHVYQRFPLRYDSLYWSAVFPLGMYAVSTMEMARAIDLPFLQFIPGYFLYLALFAWFITFLGLVYTLIRQLLPMNA